MSASFAFDETSHCERLERDGYSIVDDVLQAEEVAVLRIALDSLPPNDAVRRRGQTYGIRNLLEISPAVRDLCVSRELRQLVTPILGEGCFAVRGIFFDKVPGANWGLGWHQDRAIAVRERRDVPGFRAWSRKAGVLQVQPPTSVLARMLALRVHLDDNDALNGPLRVVPGSHDAGRIDTGFDEMRERRGEITCHVSAGGVLAMRPLLLHASSAAERPGHRRVIHLEFAADDLPGGLEWNRRVSPDAHA